MTTSPRTLHWGAVEPVDGRRRYSYTYDDDGTASANRTGKALPAARSTWYGVEFMQVLG